MAQVATPNRPVLVNRLHQPAWTHSHPLPPSPGRSPSLRNTARYAPELTTKTPPAIPYLSMMGTATAPARVPSHKRAREDSAAYTYPNTNSLAQSGAGDDPPRVVKKSRIVADGKSPARLKLSKEDRGRAIENFKEKYTRAFPSFKFHFDLVDSAAKGTLANAVSQLGAVSFFSAPALLLCGPLNVMCGFDIIFIDYSRILFICCYASHHEPSTTSGKSSPVSSQQQGKLGELEFK